jgi:hypothetical protein
MLTTPFLRLVDLQTGEEVWLNVVSYEENAPEWNGEGGRAFDGTYISTEINAKWSASAVVEFLTGAEMEALEKLTASEWDFTLRMPLALRPLVVWTTGDDGALRGTQGTRRVYAKLGKRVAYEHVIPNPGGNPPSRLAVGWRCDLQLIQI